MGDANTGTGYGYLLYGLSPEEQKKYITKESDPDILKRDGFEKVFERFLNAEPPNYKALREASKVAEEKKNASWKDFDPKKIRPEGEFDESRSYTLKKNESLGSYFATLKTPAEGRRLDGGISGRYINGTFTPAFENPYVLPTAQQIADKEAFSKAFKDKNDYDVNDYRSYQASYLNKLNTPNVDTKDFEKLITNQEPISEEKKQPPKEEVFEKLLNKVNTSQKEEQPIDPFRRGSWGDYAPQEEQPINAFGRGSWGDYMPQEEEAPTRGGRDAFGRIQVQEEAPTRGGRDAFGSSEKENVQAAPKTKANDFLEAYKGAIETNTTNNKNEDIAAVYKPSAPPVETWQEKLEKDAIRNQNKPIPTGIPYRRGTGLGDHMGADASEEINNARFRDAFGQYTPQEEEAPTRGGRDAFGRIQVQEEEQPRRGGRNAFDSSQYYA